MFSSKGDLFLLFVVFYLSSLVLECKGNFPQPSACSLRECPPYEVIHSDKEYEIRSYKEANWVSSPTIVSDSYQNAADKGFLTIDVALENPKIADMTSDIADMFNAMSTLCLFDYFLGGNREEIKINLTSPILVDVDRPTVDVVGTAYTVFAYLPQKYQDKMPTPNTDKIKRVKLPRYKYGAVRRFGGYIKNGIIPTEIAALRKTLQGSPYERVASIHNFTLAGYNSPFEFEDRANEVILWFDEM